MPWCFHDEETEEARALLFRVADSGAHVPTLWLYEVANSLHFGVRRERMSSALMTEKMRMLATLPLTFHEAQPSLVFNEVGALARRFKLTIYDACYIELALRLGLPLASRDTELRSAAREAGVEVLQA